MDVISAISTAAGTGGVAIIRLSGEGALSLASRMFAPDGKTAVADFSPYRMYTGKISGEGFTDYGMCVYFRAPKSFTGEDSVEFHCHGGVAIARGILAKTLSLGARAAEKGEFTKRAFLNGKLSLSSAEGMIDMINAESLASVRAGEMLYNEKLSAEIKSLQDALKDVLAAVSVDIDYPEEDAGGFNAAVNAAAIAEIADKIERLASTYGAGKRVKDGVTVAICGRPNVGKSSLLNALLGCEKAIVSDEEGTTRDAVEGDLLIDGIKLSFFDTAGIRENSGAVESIGIERAKSILRSADIVLSVDDGRGEVDLSDANGEILRVFNKCDLKRSAKRFDAQVSAATGEGLEGLKNLIAGKAMGETSLDKVFIIERRHYGALLRAAQSLRSAADNAGIITQDLIAVDLKDAWDALGEITGETASEQIINTVFEKFCVGK